MFTLYTLKSSSMVSKELLQELEELSIDTDNQKLLHTCNSCQGLVETRHNCTQCEDFNLCVKCFQKNGHPHKMEKLGFDLVHSPVEDTLKEAIKRCMDSLEHACKCLDVNCQLPSCLKMKRVMQHSKICPKKTLGGCPICKQLIALCFYHAKSCLQLQCKFPFCLNIKHKLKQQKLQPRLQQAQLLRRKMHEFNTKETASTSSSQEQLQLGSAPVTEPNQQIEGAAISAPPTTACVNTMKASLRELLETLKSPNTPEQQQKILQILKLNPQLMAAFINQREARYRQGLFTPVPPVPTANAEGETSGVSNPLRRPSEQDEQNLQNPRRSNYCPPRPQPY